MYMYNTQLHRVLLVCVCADCLAWVGGEVFFPACYEHACMHANKHTCTCSLLVGEYGTYSWLFTCSTLLTIAFINTTSIPVYYMYMRIVCSFLSSHVV